MRINYGIEGDEADAIISDAIADRRSAIRNRALVGLVFAVIGLAIPAAYFAIQGFVGFVVIGFGPIFMGLLGFASLVMAGRSIYRLVTGELIRTRMKRPNQALEPTTTAVTIRAGAQLAPAVVVAHL